MGSTPTISPDVAEPSTARPLLHGVWRRLNHPLFPGLIALLGTLAYALARWRIWAHGNITAFIMVGRLHATSALLPHGMVYQPTYGYDGQFFYRMALNPFDYHQNAYGISVDHAYRYSRIGYPLLAWLVSLGRHETIPFAMVGINVLAVAAIAVCGGMFARQAGRHALWGMLLAGYFGLAVSVGRDLGEPVAAACLLAGLLAVRAKRPVLAAALFTYGAMTRETVCVAVAALAVVRLAGMAQNRRRDVADPGKRLGRADLAWFVPAVIFAAWQGVLRVVTGTFPIIGDGGRNVGLPGSAVIDALRYNLTHLSFGSVTPLDIWVLEFATLLLFIVSALMAWRSTSAPLGERLALIFFVIELFALTPTIWSSYVADLRSLIEAYLLSAIVLLGVPRRGGIAARLLPVLCACAVVLLAIAANRHITQM